MFPSIQKNLLSKVQLNQSSIIPLTILLNPNKFNNGSLLNSNTNNGYNYLSNRFYTARFKRKVDVSKNEILEQLREGWINNTATQPEYVIDIPLDKISIKWTLNEHATGQDSKLLCNKVVLYFDINKCAWLPEEIKQRFIELHEAHIDKDGIFTLAVTKLKTYQENEKEAFKLLQAMIDESCLCPSDRIDKEGRRQYIDIFKARKKGVQNKKAQRHLFQGLGFGLSKGNNHSYNDYTPDN